MACVEAEEIARLAVDLEQAVRRANSEAEKRREAEERLAATEKLLLRWKSGDVGGDRRGRRWSRSRSPTPSPRGGTGSRGRGPTETAGGSVRADSPTKRAWGNWEGKVAAERGCVRENGGAVRSLQSPSRATGSTIASRGRRSGEGRPAREEERAFVGEKGRSSTSPRRDRGADKERRRPWKFSPPSSPNRGEGGFGASVKPAARRQSWGCATSPSEQKSPSLRSPKRAARFSADGAAAVSRRDAERRGRADTGDALPCETEEPFGRSNGRRAVGRREVDARGAGDVGRPSTAERGGSDAVSNGGSSRRPSHRANGAMAVAEKYPTTELRRGRRPSGTWQGEADGAASGAGTRAPNGGGEYSNGASTAGAIAAAIRGVDLTATIARELRLAVATTTSASPASPASEAGFAVDCAGDGTVADGSTARRERRRGPERRTENSRGILEGGTSSGRRANVGKKHVSDVVGPSPGSAPPGDGGRALKSREVAELESDVQHIFQFFAAKDRGGKTSHEHLGLFEDAGGLGEREEDYMAAIAGALA